MSERRTEEVARAKINLALHVRERMADGYHRIETLFAFAEDGDRLRVEVSEGLELALEGPFAGSLGDGPDNLVLRAAHRLRDRFGISAGARLVLDKRLPVAAGIGGGSADAAATIRLLARWWGIDADPAVLESIAAELGADVPACLLGRTARGEGKGDRLTPVESPGLSGIAVLLVNPGTRLGTADVFRNWDGVDRGPLGDWRDGRNDLTAAALALVPQIKEVLVALGRSDFARMSGSGATCFGLYANAGARDADAAAIRAAQPSWWQLATRIV